MPNSTTPFGAIPATTESLYAHIKGTVPVSANTSGIQVGDFIQFLPAGLDSIANNRAVAPVAAGVARVDGVVVSVQRAVYQGDSQNKEIFVPAGIAADVRIATDGEFEIRGNGFTTGATPALEEAAIRTIVNLNASVAIGTKDGIGGSGYWLDEATAATTAALPLQIIGVATHGNNELSRNPRYKVILNNTAMRQGTAGV